MRSIPVPVSASLRAARTPRARVAEALRAAVLRGSVAAGELLPSTRALAASFGAHRHTILAALDALVAEGLIQAEPRVGYRVCGDAQPILARELPASKASYGFRIVRNGSDGAPPRSLERARYPLHAALPDCSLLPLRELRAAYAHVLARASSPVLASISERGHAGLCRELLRYLRRARAIAPEDMLLTSGSQEAIALVAQTLLKPGDVVAVEDPGYPPAWDAFRDTGAEIVPIRVDEHGLDVDALGTVCRRRRVRLLYVTPNHQFPTTVTLSAPRRSALLELTLQHGVPILEDDYDHEYHFRGVPQAPLAASPAAPHVLYVATLSKLVAPAVRVGMLAGDRNVVAAAARRRRLSVRAGDAITQAALAEWIAEGGFERHLRRARRTYLERRNSAVAAVAAGGRDLPIEHTAPDGGLALWTRWPKLDVLRLAESALARGVTILPEPLVSSRADGNGVRLAYGAVPPRRFAQALEILVAVARSL